MWLLIRLVLFPLKLALKVLAPIVLLLGAAAVGYLFFWLPDVSVLALERPETTSFIELTKERFQRQGRTGRVKQTWVELDRISPALVEAVLIAEDDRFYYHRGFDVTELMNAAEANLKSNRNVRGGSTLTQQLAKNLYLTPEKTYTRKLNEALLTWKLEHSLSKDRILELYLNVAEWGDGIFGVEEAARTYFKKSAAQLDDREAVVLAARLPNPYDNGDRSRKQREAREKIILARLEKSPPGFRGSQRSLLAERMKGSKGAPVGVMKRETAERIGSLARQKFEQWWEETTISQESLWREPAPVSSPNPRPKKVPPPVEAPARIPPVLEEVASTAGTTDPPSRSAAVRDAEAAARNVRSESPSQTEPDSRRARMLERIERIERVAQPLPAQPDSPAPTPPRPSDAERKRSAQIQEKLASLERKLSKQD